MGTTDNFDSPASGALALTDEMPIKSAATGRAATATVAQMQTGMNSLGYAVVAASTVTATNTNYGITTLSSSTIGYTLTAPIAGVRKTISALIASTSSARTINAGAGATFDGTNNLATSTGIQTLELVGVSTLRWQVVSNYSPTTGAMTFSTA